MALVCRLCRAKASSTHYCSLVSSLAVQSKLSSRLESLLEVEVNTKDGLPHIICNKCKRHFETLERASEDLTRFRRQARDSFVALSARGITKRMNVALKLVYHLILLTTFEETNSKIRFQWLVDITNYNTCY